MKLPRRLTLNSRADFQAVREQGKSASGRFLVLAALPKAEQDHWCYALITTKKTGKAHERNHIRRLIRAALVKEGSMILPGHDLVFIARWKAKKASYAEIRKEVLFLTRKLNLQNSVTHEAKS